MYFSFFGVSSGGSPFIFKIDTEKEGSATKTIVIPTVATGTYDCSVDWGDGTSNAITVWNDANWTHVYATAGEKTVTISGQFEGFQFNNGGDRLKLLEITQWGEGFKLGTIEGLYFYGCENLEINVTDTLNVTGLVNMAGTFANCSILNSNLDWLDTSNVTDMNSMFQSCFLFNQSVTGLNTSKVENMSSMFYECTNFNQPVSTFDTAKVENMNLMFYLCTNFDQDISNFDISSLTTATWMLNGAGFSNANYDLLLVAWEGKTHNNTVRIDVPCKYTFGSPSEARSRLINDDSWTINDDGINEDNAFIIEVDTTKWGSANDTFVLPVFPTETYDYYIDWGDGTVEHITTDADQTKIYTTGGVKTIKITGIFPRIYFNLNYSNDIAKITDIVQWGNIEWSSMSGAFAGCENLEPTYTDVPDFSNVTDMSSMFSDCYKFDHSVSDFDTSNVTNMSRMFYNCLVFNQSVSNFDTSSVTDMSDMFGVCYLFNQSVSNFNTSNVTNMSRMFEKCYVFNQSVSNFNTSNVTDMSHMFYGCYVFDQSVSNFDTSKVVSMSGMFRDARVFNQSVSNFNTALVTNMSLMFYNAYLFNQSVSNFNTTLVTNMGSMFYNAYPFNQSVSNFNTSNVTNMISMFKGCTIFNQDISGFDITSLSFASGMLQSSAFSTTNYDLLLVAWGAQVEKPNVSFHAGSAKYSAGSPATARANLVTNGWIITDGGPV